jgi:flagellar biosynthesis/type III secretory pathway chaperone
MVTRMRDKLLKLEKLIELERSYAVTLKIDALKEIQEQKKELLIDLKIPGETFPTELKELAARLRDSNRRNARLLFSTLNFLRQTMNNCCESITPLTYGQHGHRIQSNANGLLHAGRV